MTCRHSPSSPARASSSSSTRSSGLARVDPVQARLTQLGSMQARTLEELELQQPFFERTVRPLAIRLSGVGQRFTSAKKQGRTEQRLAMAGNPGDLRTVDFLGLKVVVAGATAGVRRAGPRRGRPATSPSASWPAPSPAVIGFFAPDFWLSRRIKKRQKAILLAIPDTLDLLTISVQGRPRLRRRARQGRREDQGPAGR